MTRVVTSHRRIDHRRRLTPRDYLVHPDQFGENPHAEFHDPPGGDPASRAAAEVFHTCLCAYRAATRPPSGAELGRRFGFSRQTWSDVTRGRRWPGHTVVVAVLAGLRDADRSSR